MYQKLDKRDRKCPEKVSAYTQQGLEGGRGHTSWKRRHLNRICSWAANQLCVHSWWWEERWTWMMQVTFENSLPVIWSAGWKVGHTLEDNLWSQIMGAYNSRVKKMGEAREGTRLEEEERSIKLLFLFSSWKLNKINWSWLVTEHMEKKALQKKVIEFYKWLVWDLGKGGATVTISLWMWGMER